MPRPALAVVALAALTAAAPAADERKTAEEAYRRQDYKAARELAAAVAKADPKSQPARMLLGLACLHLRDNEAAADALTELIRLNPDLPDAYDRRGDAYLKLGRFADAVQDFDRVIALRPEAAPEHWRRGIALYYAGKYEAGARQFELHKTVNPQDVENAVWHYLCTARATDKETARKQLIDVTRDARVPMKEVQQLFAGRAKPADVLAAAEKVPADAERGKEARFYAHLYLGLYSESEGDAAKAHEYLTAAVQKYRIGHYMWDVANAHLAKLKKGKG